MPRPDVPDIGTGTGAPAPQSQPRSPEAPADLVTERLKVRTFAARLRHFVEVLHERTRRYEAEGRRVLAWPYYAARVLVQVVKQWLSDRCPQQASSLAYTTALSIVPLIAITLALLRASGEFEAESALVDFLAREVLPSISRDEIAKYLLSFAGNMSFQTAGIAGVVSTIVISFLLFQSVEKIFNDIWRVERRRSFGGLFVTFYAMVTLVPSLFAVSLYQAARVGLTGGTAGRLASLGASFLALFLANKLLPACRVRWIPAAIGGFLSAALFELAKYAFQLYVAKVAFEKYAGVYGALGVVPILLIWIYYTWLVTLLGAEVAHSVQNLSVLEGLDRRRAMELDGPAHVNGQTAARLMCAIARRWRAGGLASARAELAQHVGISDEVADQVLRRLREGGLVLEIEGDASGFLPSRPLTDITLADVLAVFRGEDVVVPFPGGTAPVDAVLAEIEQATRDRARAVTIDELAR